jgi:hypothetical protein
MRAATFVTALVALASCAHAPGAAGTQPEATAADMHDQAAVAWVRALADGDRRALARLTAAPFAFRATTPDQHCAGPFPTAAAVEQWIACMRTRAEVQELAAGSRRDGWVTVEHGDIDRLYSVSLDQLQADARESAERAPASHLYEEFDALKNEMEGAGHWVGVRTLWPRTSLDFRILLVGPPGAERVKAVLMDVQRAAD